MVRKSARLAMPSAVAFFWYRRRLIMCVSLSATAIFEWACSIWHKPDRHNRTQSRQVHGQALEIGERAVCQRSLVRGTQDHAGRLARLECFLPAGGTEAPPVTRL